MTKTADDLVYEVAGLLGKAVEGEALGQIEYETINGGIDNVLAEIREIVYVADRDEIDERYFQTLARLLAVHSASKFANAPLNLDEVRQHENRLRYLAARPPTYEDLRPDYF
ncbi:MAG: hypothetical protein EKK40_07060 [Bradyrhizobiaceae bacterium]|nr:MAG: hypothetical protein EKK40_07060 [Bradyrhizobiaceae bacterium]